MKQDLIKKEFILESGKNYMTLYSQKCLLEELEKAKEELLEQDRSIGEAAGPQCDWHDNAGFDIAVIAKSMAREKLESIEQSLEKVEIINPREETDFVWLGNKVIVKISNKIKDLTVLGSADSNRKDGWISYKTPVGKLILNRKIGEIINNQGQSIEIIDILPGDF